MPPKLPRGAGCLWSLIWHTLSSKVLSVLSCCAGHRVIHWSYSMFTEGPSLWCLASASCPIALVTFQVCWGHGQGSLTHQSVFSFCPWWPLALLVGEPSLLLTSLWPHWILQPLRTLQPHSLAFSLVLREFFILPLLLWPWRNNSVEKQIKTLFYPNLPPTTPFSKQLIWPYLFNCLL